MSDLRRTLRRLLHQPTFTAVAALTLGLGIGATTTVFTVVWAIHLRPLPFPEAERLVGVHETSATKLCAGCAVGTSYPGFYDWREAARSFEGMAAYTEQGAVIAGDDEPEPVTIGAVSGEFFTVLRAHAVRGRTVGPGDDQAGAERVAVLSHWLWQRRYAGETGAIGRTIRLNGVPHTVIGVMPDWVRIPEFADLWVALAPTVESTARDERSYSVVARLAPGVTVPAADAEMQTIASGLASAYPDVLAEWSAGVSSFREDLGGDVGPIFWLLLGAVGLVLLVACANLSGLLLARAAARERELAVRAALGATRLGLAKQLLAEALVLGALGGALGLVLSIWGVDLVRAMIQTEIPHWIEFRLDGGIVTFCTLAALGTGLLFGLLPALRYSRPDVVESLKQSSATLASGRRQRLRGTLVVVETALALVLLSGAGLMGRTFLRLTGAPAEYDTDGLVFANLGLYDQRYAAEAEITGAVNRIVERIGQGSGRQVAVRRFVFLAGFGAREERVEVEGLSETPAAGSPRFASAVTPGYAATLRLQIVAGREFTPADDAGAPVVLVNERMASVVWPGTSAVGRRIRLPSADGAEPWRTVIGVVSNGDGTTGRGGEVPAYAYIPLAQAPGSPLMVLVRSSEPIGGVARAIRSAVAELDPDATVEDVRTAEDDLVRRWWFVGFFATLLSAFAAFAVLLAAMGLYGIVAFQVVERRREIGLRTALGARRPEVVGTVVRRGLRLAGLGVTMGLVLSAGLNRVLGAMLFGTSPVDPLVLGSVAIALIAVTLLASLIPAWRATGIDPMEALRHE